MELFFAEPGVGGASSSVSSADLLSVEYWVVLLSQLVAALVLVPAWILAGVASAGWLWPPQIREWLLVQNVVSVTTADVANVISSQISRLLKEIHTLRIEVRSEMKNDRLEIVEMKAEAEAMHSDVMADMIQIKEIMSTLLELRKAEFQEQAGLLRR